MVTRAIDQFSVYVRRGDSARAALAPDDAGIARLLITPTGPPPSRLRELEWAAGVR